VVAAPLATVRAQIVHNDIALGNVLVDEHRRVSGITDFGDMTHTALVCDLAVTIADVLSGRDDWSPQAEAIIAGYASVTPLTPDEIDLLPDLIAGRCAAAMTISSWRDATQDVSPGPSLGGWQMLQDIAELDRAELRARFTAAASGAPSHRRRTTSELLAAREQVLGPLALSYATPLHLVRGEGVELEAADGRRYLDAYNNVPVLGHSHPAMTAAVTAQLQMLNSNTRYLHEAPIRLAEELLASMPPGRFDRVLFVNSGSEANDLAWRIACFATGHAGAIVTEFAYHGVTTVTTALSPETGVDPAAFAVRRVAPPPPVGTSEPDVARAVGELGTVGVAAMFVDGVFTSDGVLGPAHQWTRAAAAAVHAAGGVYVADEVQAGYGRTGEHLWSFAAGGVDADLVTLGKPMGNGFPVAAVVTRGELVDEFMQRTDYFSTFGGSPVACAAGLAVLDTIRREGLVTNARIVGDVLRSRLADMAATSPRLGAPRGWGLAVGVDVLDDDGEPDAATAQRVVNGLRERGVLIGRTAATGATLKIRPPLVFTERHAGRLAIDLGAVLTSLSAT
jgi:4-aminobutyrate aminotransferase-like enzyme